MKDIIDRCFKLDIYEKRSVTDDYCELVFHNKDNSEWESIITDFLGVAVKGPKAKPSKSDDLLTNEYGGINVGQTLFKKEFKGFTIIAMFWPWGDGGHTTLKLIRLSK